MEKWFWVDYENREPKMSHEKKTVPTQQILSGKSVEKSEHDMPSAIIILGYKICIK